MNTEQPSGDSPVSIDSRAAALFGPGGVLGTPEVPRANEPKPRQQPQQTQAQQQEPSEEVAGEVDQEAASQEESEAPQPETFEVEIEGERFVLPKKLEKAIMQERDYTQKSQTIAQREKQIEHMQQANRIANFRAEFEQEVAPELKRLQAYDAVLAQAVDVNGLSDGEASKLFFQRSQWKDEREAIVRSLNEKQQQWAQKTDAALRDLAAKSDEIVRQRVPNWTAETWKTISEHAKQDGYSDVELSSINDPRHKLTLWKAQQYDALKAKATKTVVDAKTVKTGPTNPMPQHVKDNLNFRKQIAKTAPGSMERQKTVEQRVGSLFAKR